MSDFTGDMTGAVEAAFSAASTPDAAPTTTTETQPASAVETPVADVSQTAEPTQTSTTQEPGPIPYPRFKEVNDKAQTASKELEALAWAKGIDPNLAQSAIQLLTRAQNNPLAFTEELETLRDHPVLGPQLRSWAARTLGFRNPSRPTETVEETMPEPDLHFEDGRKAYSAEQLQKRDQFLLKQWESKIDERIAPIAKGHAATEKYVADQVYEGIKTQAASTAKSEIEALQQQYPQFEEHRKDVAAVMEAHPKYTLEQAWAKVFVEKVGPKLAGQQAATVNRKVQAGTGSANPARPSGATPKPAEGFKEALEQAFGVTSNA